MQAQSFGNGGIEMRQLFETFGVRYPIEADQFAADSLLMSSIEGEVVEDICECNSDGVAVRGYLSVVMIRHVKVSVMSRAPSRNDHCYGVAF